MLNLFNGQFIGRYLDETAARRLHHRTLFAFHEAAPSWRRRETVEKALHDVLRLDVAHSLKARYSV
jgi:hypothetical protein